MSIPRPRNILEESYEKIERDIQGHCNYLAVLKREVMRHGREPKDLEELTKGFYAHCKSMFRFCYELLVELRDVRRENVELYMENERLKADVPN